MPPTNAPLISAPSGLRPIEGHPPRATPPGELSYEGKTALAALQAFRSESQRHQSTQSFAPGSTASLGYLANKRRASSYREPAEPLGQRHNEVHNNAKAVRPLQKSRSFVRLSMTSEGAAKIVTKESSSPSPPRPSQSTPQLLDARQSSGIPTLKLVPGAREVLTQNLRRSASGRSRDSRAWEFWCDKDSRSKLEETAEKDASGSAADAIGLMRANSGRKVLGTLSAKRNALLTRQPSAKRAKHDHDRPTLQRANTSGGRLQQSGGSASVKHLPKLKYSDSAASIAIPGSDSDKENWTPERDATMALSRRTAYAAPATNGTVTRRVLGESRVMGNTARQSRVGKSPRKPAIVRAGHDESDDPEANPELTAFMGRDHKSSSISQDEELDCVQGLLSLSQGNWR
jgi:hypothetical protein